MIFVTAVYKIYENDYIHRVLDRLRLLASVVPVHVVTDLDIPGVTVIPCAFEDLDTYKTMRNVSRLPACRSPEKDTLEFMILMNAKTECIRRVRDAGYVSDTYVWLDAGITKILSDPVRRLQEMMERCESLPADRIVIPGCWDTPCEALYSRVCWRFCGGLFVVPSKYVDSFAEAVLAECARLGDLAVWEVNVWASIEHTLPILWTHGDHNDRLFDLKTD